MRAMARTRTRRSAGVTATLLAAVTLAPAPARAQAAPEGASAPAQVPANQAGAEASTERTAAWFLLVGGGIGISTGVVLGVLSVVEHRRSRDAFEEAARDEEDPTAAAQAEYAAAVDARDDFRLASGIAAGTGLGMFLAAGLLFAIDAPDASASASVSSPRAQVQPLLRPLLGPGLAGARATVSF
jgi:hypothetical protein